MNLIIQKFGGTSVSTVERRLMVTEKVKDALNKGLFPIVVVSAMGRMGDPYATDTLLSLLPCEFRKANLRAMDLLLSCGEIISSVVLCADLMEASIDAMPLTGGQAGIITDSNFGNARTLNVITNKILNLVDQGIVPVVTGFQGEDERGFITTLGRGGSDVTASLLGAALKTSVIEIYTDVDGIMTADPSIVKDASLIDKISYREVFQLAEQGARVIHPRAVDIAMRANIPIVIKNTLSSSKGTIINSENYYESKNIITGITNFSGKVQIKVKKEDNLEGSAYDNLFDLLAENMINIDLINVFPDIKVFTIDNNDYTKFKEIVRLNKITAICTENCSKISLIGSKMHNTPGVMARILKTMASNNINVLQTADSYMTIWCLIEDTNTKKAINALHREFYLSN